MGSPAIDLNNFTLSKGNHADPSDGVCLNELASLYAGESMTDHPSCVSPALCRMGGDLNDSLPDNKRQLLKPLIPYLIGTAGDGLDDTRGFMALDWLTRVYAAVWLEAAGLTYQADVLRGLRQIADSASAATAHLVVGVVSDEATAKSAGLRRTADMEIVHAAAAALRVAHLGLVESVAFDMAWDASYARLTPAVAELQDSMIALFEAMISPPKEESENG